MIGVKVLAGDAPITAFGKAAAFHTTIKRYPHGAVCSLAHFISDRSELKGRCFCMSFETSGSSPRPAPPQSGIDPLM